MMDRSPIPTFARLPELPPQRFTDRKAERASVPCGSCSLCCRLMTPLAEEEFQEFDWVWMVRKDTGERLGRALRRKPDGSCVYLGENGCTIHDRAPHVCARFDCRELFKNSDRAWRRQAIRSGKLPKALFDRGREMLEMAR